MGKAPAFQFYIKDWLSDPQLKMASHTSKGVWIDILCYLWQSQTRGEIVGTKDQIQRMIGCSRQDLEQFLDDAQRLAFCDISVTDNATVTVRNRRMYREEKERQNNRVRQQRHRESRKNNGDITPLSPSPTPKRDTKVSSCGTRQIPYQEIVEYLNQETNSHYSPQTEATRRLIKARWNEGHRIDAFKFVIDVKTAQWRGDDKMLPYLRPQTLFGTKFEAYLNEAMP